MNCLRACYNSTPLLEVKEAERRSTILRTMDLDNDLLDEMEQWLSKKTLRNTRHRRMLQAEWERAGREVKSIQKRRFLICIPLSVHRLD